ncbi:MAG: type II toxin-antitoxin system YhaV family toxin [Rhodobacteraceae bacterium]|nr:type II toxin-antitoxin system YhaV family toxin [Paracoccaceae bacterium]
MTGGLGRLDAPLVVNGWSFFAHPVFLEQLEALIGEVETRRLHDPENWRKKNCTKRLAAIFRLISEVIPADPGAPVFRQGDTLGDQRKHWFRAKFFQQYRLFYRFNRDAKVIVLAWVNDDATLRAYGSKTDAYATFRNMLESGNPPDDFDALMREATAEAERFRADLEREVGR